ncbi:MAG: OmpA family protein, partial [Planctomycetales bacterium]|nr:OmpA family protein [Planctomycetales bacterium]
SLLLAHDRQSLEQLAQQVEQQAIDSQRLSEILPGAVRLADEGDESLARALGPLFTKSFDNTVKRHPQSIVNAISPIMGPAIRQSIRQTLQAMLQGFNQVIEHTFSAKGLSWRWESWRTGIPFAQVVLFHSLKYRVDEVYLIHRETGLLLSHAVDPSVTQPDADIISGMLTAIQSFIHDSFQPERETFMDTVEFRDREGAEQVFWIEGDDKLLLAARMFGSPPQSVRPVLRESLARIHNDLASEIDAFRGDNSAFQSASQHIDPTQSPLAAAEEYLADCLLTEFAEAEQGQTGPRLVTWAIGAALVVGLMALSVWGLMWWSQHRKLEQLAQFFEPPETVTLDYREGTLWARGAAHAEWIEQARKRAHLAHQTWSYTYDDRDVKNLDAAWLAWINALQQEPGIQVTEAKRQGPIYRIRGLRDPLAADPATMLTQLSETPVASTREIQGTSVVPPTAELGLRLDQIDAQWSPFLSLDHAIVLRRIQAAIDVPESVTVMLAENRLTMQGTSPTGWKREALEKLESLPGIQHIDATQLIEDPSVWDRYVDALRHEPGLIVLDAEQHPQQWIVRGLRDPLARDPLDVAQEFDVDPGRIQFTWSDFVSGDSRFVVQRVESVLKPPSTVQFRLDQKVLFASGTASAAWIESLQQYARLAPGIERLDSSGLLDIETHRVAPVRQSLEDAFLLFEKDDPMVADSAKSDLDLIATQVAQLVRASEEIDKQVRVDIVGHSAPDEGSGYAALQISESRAKNVWQYLVHNGVPGNIFVTKGDGLLLARTAEGQKMTSEQLRRVTFRVRVGSWSE